MVKSVTNFTDSLVIILDNRNKLITETIVTGHNRDEMYIEVTEGLESVTPGARLRLMIIHPDGVSEFNGTLKYTRQGIYEIPIFGEHRRGARATARYLLNADALIKEMVVNSETVSLRDPIQVTLENISKSGIFIKSPEIRFINDVVLWIEFNVKDKEMVLNAKVVREQKNNDNSYSYGCQLVFRSGEK